MRSRHLLTIRERQIPVNDRADDKLMFNLFLLRVVANDFGVDAAGESLFPEIQASMPNSGQL